MELIRLSERLWYYPFEQERDRPNLGYIRGDSWSLAVDAGHSAAHTAEFYRALREAGLPLPRLTALTHWHWDHTFGMHAVHGLCVANARTEQHLRTFRERIRQNGPECFLSMDERIRREYADGQPVVITLPDIVFADQLRLDAGNCLVRLFCSDAPHTDDTTLVLAEDEDILFIGDAACGALPDWKKDPARCQKLADSIAAADARTVLDGHWTPQTSAEVISDLLSLE